MSWEDMQSYQGETRQEYAKMSLSNPLKRINPLNAEHHRLHVKMQQVVSQWTALFEKNDHPEIKVKASGAKKKLFPIAHYAAGMLTCGILAAVYAMLMYELIFFQPVMASLSIWCGLGIFGILFFQFQSRSFAKLIWPLWIGFIAALSSVSVLTYLCLVVGILLWIRYEAPERNFLSLIKMGADVTASYGAVAICVYLEPTSAWALAFAVFLFCTIQAMLSFLYFNKDV